MPVHRSTPATAFPLVVVQALLIATLLVCVWQSSQTLRPAVGKPCHTDFCVYTTAAILVRDGQSAHIYDGADTGVDPQFLLVADGMPYANVAHSLGLGKVAMYVYPPLLADLLVPLTFLGLPAADMVWWCFNLASLLVSGLMLQRIVGVRWNSLPGVAVLAGVAAMGSAVDAINYGQVTVLVSLALVAGLYFYQRGWIYASSFAIALAAGLKLTPLIALVPFLLWKEWRWVRGFLISFAALLAGMVLVNSRAVVMDYFVHVAPAMSRGIPSLKNRTILSCLKLSYGIRHGISIWQISLLPATVTPAWLTLLGKAIGLLLLCALLLWIYRQKGRSGMVDRLEMLAAIALLSAVISPVSWVHAYVVALPALVMLWNRQLRLPQPWITTVLLVVCSLSVGGFCFEAAQRHLHNPWLITTVSWQTPLLALVCIVMLLWHSPSRQQLA